MKPKRSTFYLLVGALLGTSLHAQDYTWTGGGGNNAWGQAANWDSTPTFNADANLFFHAQGAARLTNGLGASRTIATLTFNDNSTSDVTIGLRRLDAATTTVANLTMGGGAIAPAITVTAGSSGSHTIGDDGTITHVFGNLILAGNLTVTHDGSGTLAINRPITETGGARSLLKAGSGVLILSGANTYTGGTTINGGVLVANSANAIPGGLAFGGTGSAISFNGGILGLGDDTGDFTRLPNGATIAAGRVTFTGNGGFAAYGEDRTVNFGGSNGIVAIGSTTTANIGSLNGKTLILGASTATHKVTVTNTLDFGNATRTIQVVDGAAAVDAEISGVIQQQSGGTAGFTKTGNGTLLLSNDNTYTGATSVNGGTLLVGGSIASDVTVANGAALGGTGTIGGSVTVIGGGTLAPGASIESLAVGSLSMTASSTFAYEVANNSATGADLLAVGSTISLSGVTLGLDAASIAALSGGGWNIGDKLTLISYFEADVTSGFTGYEDNTSYVFGANEWLFDYNDTVAGGNYAGDAVADGQNRFVTMTVIPEPGAALLGGLGLLALLRRRR